MEAQHDKKTLKKNTLISLLSLFFQSGYSAILGLVANFILTVVLPPATFGVYILTLSIMAFFNYFSDIGLAASLVQKKDISDEDVKTTFTIQQFLVITLIIIGFLLTDIIQTYYKLPGEAVYLYWSLLGAFFLSSLKTIPSIFLERKIQFQKIVLVQIVENTIFYITVSVLALAGLGLFSFAYAVLIRALVGTILMYYISFWIPQIGISRMSMKNLLSFGIPFQTNSLLALIKDDLLMVFLGGILGLDALGYIGWAKRWAEAPIRIIMDNVNRILFPVFSRIQTEKDHIAALVNKVLYFQTMLLAPIYVGMILLMHYIVELVPKYSKWEPALPIFYLICISAFFSSYSTPFINVFNAVKRVGLSFRFMLYWTAMTWLLVPILTNMYGNIGYPITLVILSLTFIVIVNIAKTIIPFTFLESISPAVLSAFIMGIIVLGITRLGVTVPVFLASSILGATSYIAFLYFIFKRDVIRDIRSILKYE